MLTAPSPAPRLFSAGMARRLGPAAAATAAAAAAAGPHAAASSATAAPTVADLEQTLRAHLSTSVVAWLRHGWRPASAVTRLATSNSCSFFQISCTGAPRSRWTSMDDVCRFCCSATSSAPASRSTRNRVAEPT